MALRSSRTSLSGAGIRLTFNIFASFLTVAVLIFLALSSFLFITSSDPPDIHSVRKFTCLSGCGSVRRSVLALKSDPSKPQLDQIKKQADDHRSLALAYASYAQKLKLGNSKLIRVFAELSRNFTDLISKPSYRTMFDSDGNSMNESVLRQFEKEVKERIKLTQQLVAEGTESFDNQLKIQKPEGYNICCQ
ncbi:Galacturonosyltransferase 8 [Capsicum chinense]|nr:Galacturonosyltransferase 8 [Capsicum chinense]